MDNTLHIEDTSLSIQMVKVNNEVVQGEVVESAETIHSRICDNFDKVEKTLYEICVDLKTIRDNKYYKKLGYDTFEGYCWECFNIKQAQAYKYCSIAENLSSEFFYSSRKIGINKLYILSRLTDEERTELVNTTDLEHTPVKEVEQKAKEIKENQPSGIDVDDENTNTLTIEDVISKIYYSYDKTKEVRDFCIYNCKYQVISKSSVVLDDLKSYYDYVKKFNKLFNIDLNSLGESDFKYLDYVLSDFIEVSRRFNACLFDLKDYIRKFQKEKEDEDE